MRYLLLPLLLAACSHPVRQAAPPDPGTAQARALVRAKFTTGDTQVVAVEASPAPRAPVFDFACTFRRMEFGKTCRYVAKGQLDAATRDFRFSHRVTTCAEPD